MPVRRCAPPYPRTRPDDLRKWLHHLGCHDRGVGGDKWWTKERVEACARDPRQASFDTMRIGRWHFKKEMLGPRGRFNWSSPVRPFPCVTEKEAMAALYPGAEREPPLARALNNSLESCQDRAAGGHLKRLRDENSTLAEDNNDLRDRIAQLEGMQSEADALLQFQKEALAEAEQAVLTAEAQQQDLEATIAQLEAAPKAWLSTEKLQSDPMMAKNIKEFSFFPTVESHCTFFDLINTDSAAEKLVLYRTGVFEKSRKHKLHARPKSRKVLAQDQMLMTFVLLIQGQPMSLIGCMFGGLASSPRGSTSCISS